MIGFLPTKLKSSVYLMTDYIKTTKASTSVFSDYTQFPLKSYAFTSSKNILKAVW